jgi:DNA modification methylase
MQLYKSVYFPPGYTKSGKSECIRLAFNPDKDEKIYKEVKNLRSSELRTLFGGKIYEIITQEASDSKRSLNNYCLFLLEKQLGKIKKAYGEKATLSQALTSSLINKKIDKQSGTSRLSKTEKIHRWYPYIEGYSCAFVNEIISSLSFPPNHIYDPFSGSGTTQIAASHLGIPSSYSEINPFMRFVIDTKVNTVIHLKNDWGKNKQQLLSFFQKLTNLSNKKVSLIKYKEAFNNRNYFREDVIKILLSIRNLIAEIESDNHKNLLNLALSSMAVKVSNMIRRADLRYKTEKELSGNNFDALSTFRNKLLEMIDDLDKLQKDNLVATSIYSKNAKDLGFNGQSKYDLVITSPPYVNGTNYFRNSKIELWLTGFIESENELKKFRKEAVVSGINNVSKDLKPPLKIHKVEKIAKDLERVAYDKRIPELIRHYFSDMKKAFFNIHKNLEDYGKVFVDIGDSQFAGIHIPTDELLEEIAKKEGLEMDDKLFVRERYSKNGMQLKQVILVFSKSQRAKNKYKTKGNTAADCVVKNYSEFKETLPYRLYPYSKRNWGHSMHSLCSYQGKLKPAIAHFLVNMSTRPGMKVLDPLGGVGTIPLEACLNGRTGISNDISLLAHTNALAKVRKKDEKIIEKELNKLEKYIKKNPPSKKELEKANIGFNKSVKDYYHLDTLKEIISSRIYFSKIKNFSPEQAFIFASLLHTLHGNRPYALSRRSHPITPFAPRGEFQYKSVIEKTKEKAKRMLGYEYPEIFTEGESLRLNYKELGKKIEKNSIDAVITSPPFYSSTRFYLSNWLRMWFCGWDKEDFEIKKENYLETKQIKNFNVYKGFFDVMSGLLKKNGIIIMHIGRSGKFNMGKELIEIAKNQYDVYGLVDESVSHLEKFGISDQGGTKGHQYLFLIK